MIADIDELFDLIKQLSERVEELEGDVAYLEELNGVV